jgi:Zn-finger nucleic acid-binding protein
MTIRCPHCDCEMKQVSVRANPGTLIVLDQCGKCGGVWCDKWELFPTAPEEAQRIDPVDDALLKNPAALDDKPLYCPRCTERLQLFHDPLLPRDIQLQRCRRAKGSG